MIRRRPVGVGRNIVDVGRIFAVRAPGIADVVEEIGPEHMASEAPTFVVALAEHMHGAEADLIDAAHVPAQVVHAGPARLAERNHVVIAAVHAVHERDAFAGMVGKPEPKHLRIEFDGLHHVRGEHQHMREPAGMGAFDGAAVRRAAMERRRGRLDERALLVGRRLRRDRDFDRVAVVVVDPDPVRLDARRPIDALDAEGLELLGEAVEIVLEYAERDVLVLLARSLADRAPDMRTALRRERESGAAFADLEPEFVVKGFGRGQIRDDEMEMVERMHAELAGPARRLHETLNCRHVSPPRLVIVSRRILRTLGHERAHGTVAPPTIFVFAPLRLPAQTTVCRCDPRIPPWSSTTSPRFRNCGGFMPRPTPSGVPVITTSPGRSVMN